MKVTEILEKNLLRGQHGSQQSSHYSWIGNLSTIRRVRTFIMLFSVWQDTSTLSYAAFTILEKASNFVYIVQL